MEVVEVSWGEVEVGRQVPYELWAEARYGADVLGRVVAKYNPLPTKARESTIDVSSSIGLFRAASPISPEENERLERCLSDLILWVIHPQLAKAPCLLLIQGPTLNKLIGRLAYRFPRAELTIAVVTINTFPHRMNPFAAHHGTDGDWDGPSPPFHIDSIVRGYILRDGAIKVDLFAQGLSKYPVDEVQGGIAYGVEAKLYQAKDSIVNFADTLTNRFSTKHSDAIPLPPRQQSFFNHGDGFKEKPVLRKVAKQTRLTPYRTRDEQNELPHPDANGGQELSAEELFNAYSGQKTSTEAGAQRFEVWVEFIRSNDIHHRDDKVRFLNFMEATLKHNKYTRKYIYTLRDLTRWYGECRRGEPHGTKR